MILVESTVVGWYSRKATLKECIEMFIIFVERLKNFDPRFNEWYLGASNRKDALQNMVKLEYNDIKQQFYKEYNDNDFPETSFTFGFWNGGKTDAESFSIRASLGSGETKNWNNNCILSFPYEGEIYEHYLIKENRDQLLDLFIDHWDPDQVLHDGKWIDL